MHCLFLFYVMSLYARYDGTVVIVCSLGLGGLSSNPNAQLEKKKTSYKSFGTQLSFYTSKQSLFHRKVSHESLNLLNFNLLGHFFPLPFSTRFFLCQTFLAFISAPTGFLDWGLVTRWAQLLITLLTATYPAHRKIEVR